MHLCQKAIAAARKRLHEARTCGRVAEHFAQGHLPGAIHIHFEQIAERAPDLLPDKAAAIVTYCSNTACRNSEIAANRLAKLGYTNVRKYAERKQDWQQAGLALVAGSEVVA